MNKLPVMESFYTLQGEGMYHGSAAYFIRLAGCDVGCSWCDVKESWDADLHENVEIDLLIYQAVTSGSKIVVITGGEPLMYNLQELTTKLRKSGLRTHLETSGAYPLTGEWDWVCVSPKKFKSPLIDVLEAANELKIIYLNKDDFKWAEKHKEIVSMDCHKLLQPEWGKSDKVLPSIIEYVKSNPDWRISLQEHKYMNIP